MMLESTPSWGSVATGLFCLVMFGGFRLAPKLKPVWPTSTERKIGVKPLIIEPEPPPHAFDVPVIVPELLPSDLPAFPSLRNRLEQRREVRISRSAFSRR